MLKETISFDDRSFSSPLPILVLIKRGAGGDDKVAARRFSFLLGHRGRRITFLLRWSPSTSSWSSSWSSSATLSGNDPSPVSAVDVVEIGRVPLLLLLSYPLITASSCAITDEIVCAEWIHPAVYGPLASGGRSGHRRCHARRGGRKRRRRRPRSLWREVEAAGRKRLLLALLARGKSPRADPRDTREQSKQGREKAMAFPAGWHSDASHDLLGGGILKNVDTFQSVGGILGA